MSVNALRQRHKKTDEFKIYLYAMISVSKFGLYILMSEHDTHSNR